jgi:hypothetical protein
MLRSPQAAAPTAAAAAATHITHVGLLTLLGECDAGGSPAAAEV